MKKNFSIGGILATGLFFAFIVFAFLPPQTAQATNSACLPPYTGSSSQTYANYNDCKADLMNYCVPDSSGIYHGYSGTNVGNSCQTNTGEAGVCDNKGVCISPCQNGIGPNGIVCIKNPLQAASFFDLLNTAENVLFTFALILAPILILYAAFVFALGGGNPQNRIKGRNIIIWTTVGLLIIMASKGLVLILQSIFKF